MILVWLSPQVKTAFDAVREAMTEKTMGDLATAVREAIARAKASGWDIECRWCRTKEVTDGLVNDTGWLSVCCRGCYEKLSAKDGDWRVFYGDN